MLKAEGDTLESYLGKIEASIRQNHPDWDKQRQWRMEVSDKETIDYRQKLIRINRVYIESAFDGDEEAEEGILKLYSKAVGSIEDESN